jgi:hypothetical protein
LFLSFINWWPKFRQIFNYFTFASELSVFKTDQNFFVLKAGTRRGFLVLLLLSPAGPGGPHPTQCQTGQLTDNEREEVQDVVFVLPNFRLLYVEHNIIKRKNSK